MLSTALTIWALGKIQWSDFFPRLALPADFPIPLPEGSTQVVELYLYVDPEGVDLSQHGLDLASEPMFLLRCVADFEISTETVPLIGGFELGRACRFEFFIAFAEHEVDKLEEVLTFDEGTQLSGILRFELKVRLPALPVVEEILTIQSGDADGWVELKLTAGFKPDEAGQSQPYLNGEFKNPITIDVNFPGLPQNEPPLHTSIQKLDFDINSGSGDAFVGGVKLTGDFNLRPINPADSALPVPPIMASYLQKLFQPLETSDFGGKVEFAFQFADGKAQMNLTCAFSGARVDLDLFDMVAGVARGLPAPEGLDNPANTIDLDIDVVFDLHQIGLQIGSIAQNEPAQNDFSFELGLGLTFAGVSADMTFKLSEQEFSFGLKELTIPLAIPHFPLHLDDMNALQDSQDRWDYDKWVSEVHPGLMTLELTKYDLTQPLLEQLGEDPDLQGMVLTKPALTLLIEKVGQVVEETKVQIDAIEAALSDSPNGNDDLSEQTEQRILQEQVLPNLNQAAFLLSAKKFLIQSIFAVYHSLTQNQDQFQTYFEYYQSLMDNTVGLIYMETGISLVLSDARFVLPFANPMDIRVEGKAKLQGFDPVSPLAPLNDLSLTLGLSSEFIYLSAEGGDPIPLPEYGRYTDGKIGLKHLRIGYGFTKNDLKVAFAGELKLPKQLVEDVDTSKEFGAGIRLPLESRLAFKVDLIPITLGEVDFLLPLVEFDVDLRREGTTGLLSSQTCEPYWDGLQVHVPGFLKMAFKHARFSPFYGPLPAPNYNLSYDIVLGNENMGVSFVCDNYQVIMPVMGSIPLPLLADTTPYFDNQCVNVRLAGFGINFNLQRPYPSMSPLAIFEILGLLADPAMPIDPKGSLAETIRATIQDAYITLPPAVVRMFPELGNVVHRELNYTINLGTVITVAQQIVSILRQVIDMGVANGSDLPAFISYVKNLLRDYNPTDILRLLPPDLRRFQLQGSLVGFEASAFFFLITPEEAVDEFDRRDVQIPNGNLQLLFEDTFSQINFNGWQAVNHGLSQNGDWYTEGGALRQRNNTGGNAKPNYGPVLIYKEETFNNVVFTTILRSLDDDGIGVVFRYQDHRNYYRFRMTSQQGYWSLARIVNGHATELHRSKTRFKVGERYKVTVKTNRKLFLDFPGLPIGERSRGETQSRPVGRLPQMYVNRIEIMVNGQSWCELDDANSPLGAGYIGLECWWNNGAMYEIVRVYKEGKSWLKPRQTPNPVVLNSFQPQLGEQTLPVYLPNAPGNSLLAGMEILADFTAQDLGAVNLVETEAAGIMVGARVQVFNTQTYRFLGFLYGNGHFSFISSADVEPLLLEVAGIPFELPLEIHGRLALRGRSFGAESWAIVEASTWGSWDVIPELVRLEIGQPSKPVSIEMRSNGRFALKGSGRIALFGGQAIIEGAVDISHAHCFIDGTFNYQSGYKIGNNPVMELSLTSIGRIGPGRKFELGGAGNLKILGKSISNVQGFISDKGVSIEAMSNIQDWHWNGIDIKQFTMSLRGMLDLSQFGPPKFLFEGDTYLRLFGAISAAERLELRGRGSIRAEDGDLAAYVEGKLFWQEKEWLQGRILLHTKTGVQLEGHTNFGLILSPGSIGGVDVASMYFRINLGGKVNISLNDTFECDLHLDWDLGVNLPGNEYQTLHLASNAILLSGNLTQSIELINLDGFKLLPLQGFEVSIPVPLIEGVGNPVLKIGTKNDKISINVPQLGTLYIDEEEFMTGLTGGTLPSFTPGTLPTLFPWDPGSLPTFDPGNFPATPTTTPIFIPKHSSGEHFDADSNPASIYKDYIVSWDDEMIPIDLSTFQSLPIRFGIDKQNYRFYIQIAKKKYSLNGKLLMS